MERDLIEYIAKSLVDDPSAVSVRTVETEAGLTIELRVAPADIGKVIGKQGRIAKAIRTVLSASSVRGNKDVRLQILD
ncbi:MAG: RNA-binding protein [Spirochaetes bacterium GWD1_61_31]|nr:MAG: RNA-binding protein [Spirochaetes bacterium GWB1_60_80]OHD31146.1 MAG: RNA-binding protein [Spirochaetes bacterium GWC1_61_12]OHD35246.1 MAG: RNA-binding protein [Spirochaetes bacterium GWD1_61_31]OHD41456.1 MAG: RNA-binding protein [Spirochaetes bacterium GWE1_60_18]OHD61358.1 MAG: RNA-binding protein [Spirochaetes bacterium GWF1_60_12]HAP43357.1 RNA-binding protein [Spirochaetaceae bacterium]